MLSHDAKPVDRRTHLLALCLGVPVIFSALGVSGIETWRWVRPDSPLFVRPAPRTMADAIARDDARAAYELIRAGQDPNRPIAVRHDVLTGGRSVEMAPLVWAVIAQSDEVLPMLLAFGARPDATTRHQAVCFAARVGRSDFVRLLDLAGAEAGKPCLENDAPIGVELPWKGR